MEQNWIQMHFTISGKALGFPCIFPFLPSLVSFFYLLYQSYCLSIISSTSLLLFPPFPSLRPQFLSFYFFLSPANFLFFHQTAILFPSLSLFQSFNYYFLIRYKSYHLSIFFYFKVTFLLLTVLLSPYFFPFFQLTFFSPLTAHYHHPYILPFHASFTFFLHHLNLHSSS